MKTRTIRTIAVALDCSPHSKASLEAAAKMAARLSAELVGIFVEDTNLLRMAGLPFTEEIRLYSSTTTKLDEAQLERLLRLQAREARELLERTAEALTVRHTFRVMRGMVPEQLMSAATEADILVLGRSGRSPSCRKGLGSTARTALCESKRTVLLMRPGFSSAAGPLLVLFDGSEGSRNALETALTTADPESTLHLVVIDPEPESAEKLEQEAQTIVGERGISVEYHHLPQVGGRDLVRYLRMIDSGLLVLSDRMNLPEEVFNELVSEIDSPVLVVR
ncbi:MAG: universal stress protein [Chlorobiaceae bacterium]|nr:universal stress protein [Chlorobiaceae bacterium]NTV25556.1 universal stress protein [Chlorobiaceae bacterium]